MRRAPSRADLRDEILRKHAPTGPSGHISRCYPPAADRPYAKTKVIFRTEAAAMRAEAELAERTEALRQETYPCRYADHWHLTKRRGAS